MTYRGEVPTVFLTRIDDNFQVIYAQEGSICYTALAYKLQSVSYSSLCYYKFHVLLSVLPL